MNILSFFIASLIFILMPGTGVIYTISTGITTGRKASVLAALGCIVGIIPHLCLNIALSFLIFQIDNKVLEVIKIVGTLYLLYLGFGMIRSKTELDFKSSQDDLKALAIVRQGFLINLLNPSLTIFFFSFLPQYVTETTKNSFLQYLILSLIFTLLSLIIFIGYAILASSVNKMIEKSQRITCILPKCFGVIFITFAIQLGFSSV